jgi:hypothetical protein
MFFRVWFVYLCKLFVAGMALATLGLGVGESWGLGRLLRNVGCAIVVSLGVWGACTGFIMIFKKRLACPLCRRQGVFGVWGKSPGVECPQCGLVYCKSPLLSFHLSVEPPEPDEPDDEPDDSVAPGAAPDHPGQGGFPGS